MAYTRLDTEYVDGKVWDEKAVKKIDDSFEYLYGLIKELQERIAVLEGTDITPEKITIIDNGDGNLLITTSIADDNNGNIVLERAELTDDGNGNVVII